MTLFWLYPAVSMSLGWGLRGFIGGGSFGAMIPGVMVAIALCILLNRKDRTAAIMAAFGAVGVGFGGQETYGQTVGFITKPETFWLGLAGLSLKGAVWGLLGGLVIGVGLTLRNRRDVIAGCTLMVAGTWLGWQLVNTPKLIYFSNRLDRPREELWAGLLLGALAWLGYLMVRSEARIVAKFAAYAGIGGGIGFGLGGCVMAAGPHVPLPPGWAEWWKGMEFTFGFCFGAALGLCAWSLRGDLAVPGEPSSPPSSWSLPRTVAVCAGAIWALRALPLRFDYTIVGAILLIAALYSEDLAWQVALTLTYCAFAIDLERWYCVERKLLDPMIGWTFTVVSTLAVWAVVVRRQRSAQPFLPWAFLLLTWSATGTATLKMLAHPWPLRGGAIVLAMFLLLAALATRQMRRLAPAGARPA